MPLPRLTLLIGAGDLTSTHRIALWLLTLSLPLLSRLRAGYLTHTREIGSQTLILTLLTGRPLYRLITLLARLRVSQMTHIRKSSILALCLTLVLRLARSLLCRTLLPALDLSSLAILCLAPLIC